MVLRMTRRGPGSDGGGEVRKMGGKDRRMEEKRRKQRRETAGIKPRERAGEG